MTWAKGGDNAATHPKLLAAGAHGDERTLNEVSGFVLRCYLQSAGHMTDYVIDEGTAMLLGQSRWEELVRIAVACGLMTKLGGRRGKRTWKLLEDPEFVHLRLRADVLWQRQRERDTANPALVVPVRVRDGDKCRYCPKVVAWKGVRRGNIRGTYDHREPGKPATVETLVVSCGECNSTRGNDPDADQLLPLLPAPAQPYYSAETVEWLAGKGIYVTPGPQPVGAAGAAASAQRQAAPTGRHTAAGAASSAQRPTTAAAAGAARQGAQRAATGSADPAGPESQARDGSGRVGSVGPPPSPPPPARASPPDPPPADDLPLPTPLPERSPRARPRGKRGGRSRGSARTTTEET